MSNEYGLLSKIQDLIQEKIKAENEGLEKFLGDICYLLYGEEKRYEKVSYDDMVGRLKIELDQKHKEEMVGWANDTKRAEEEYEKIHAQLKEMIKDRDYWKALFIEVLDQKDTADEENAGILSDLCGILFEDATRAENHGYENVIEQAKFCMERLTGLVQSVAQEREEVAKRQNKLDRIKRELGVDYEEKLFMTKNDVIKSENWGPVTESEIFRARIKCTCGKSNWIKLNLDNLEDSE